MEYPDELSNKQIEIIKNKLIPDLKDIGITKDNLEEQIDLGIVEYFEANNLDSMPQITNQDLGISEDADYEERDEAFNEHFGESEHHIVTPLVIDWLREIFEINLK